MCGTEKRRVSPQKHRANRGSTLSSYQGKTMNWSLALAIALLLTKAFNYLISSKNASPFGLIVKPSTAPQSSWRNTEYAVRWSIRRIRMILLSHWLELAWLSWQCFALRKSLVVRNGSQMRHVSKAKSVDPAKAVIMALALVLLPLGGDAAAADADEAAWQTASGAANRTGYAQYLKDFPEGHHAQDAQLAMASLILRGPATSKNFDGVWQTMWTCPNLGQYPGYTYQWSGQVTGGVYHGIRGVKGQPSSMVLDGKIEADGAAAFFGEIIVGSSLVGLGAARGTPSDFHAIATFESSSGSGRRIEGRPCTLSFQRQ
jgi:hypothetical protein